jgi:DNA-binding beta-propeller fold protein YncE
MKMALGAALLAVPLGVASAPVPVALPEGAAGIGFDDLRYSTALHRVLVPAGRSGRLALIEPDTLSVTAIAGFSAKPHYGGGHDDGPTSVDEAHGLLYVTDRTAQALVRAGPTKKILGSTPLSAEPDYVRFVPTTNELWVTEPGAHRIEFFKLNDHGEPAPSGTLAVENGPESLVIDAARGRAYTHRWQKSTLAIDLKTHAAVAEWPNGCAGSRGIALDSKRGWLFVSCQEGAAAVLDVAHGGKLLSTLSHGAGFDVMGYSEKLGHLYLAGGACGCFVVLGVNGAGKLSFLEQQPAPPRTHCAVADDTGHAWVCDPVGGRLLRFEDAHPAAF